MSEHGMDGARGAKAELEKEDVLYLLKRTGLTDYEARAYLALVMRAHGSAEEVADAADIPRTSAYKVLESLRQKGYVSSRGGRPIVFHPTPPLEIRDRISSELERGFQRLDSLRGSLTEKGTPQLVYTIIGKANVLVKIGDMLDLAKEEFFLSSPALGEINNAFASKFANALKRGVFITVVAEPSARVPEASQVIRKQDLLATDIITDYREALMATPDLSICGFTDNPFLAAHLANFFQISLERPEGGG
ncbi:MAG: TrmB family transcriptional regulator [Methanomassiliicoccus sp.]|nr:TrmB family transcriptional regulator [Methanomassiliicoccus sp.]